MSESIDRSIDFILELDRLKAVERRTRPLGLSRQENSAEHSWQVMLAAWSLTPFAVEPIDTARVMTMLLVHDIGEIDAGDIIVFADIDWQAQKEAELQSLQRVFGLLDQADRSESLIALWQEFEAAESSDARYANAIDRALPALLNIANKGQSWRENNVDFDTVVKRIGPPIRAGCPALWEWMQGRLEKGRLLGWFGE
ncbi:HD domain-containing protein [Gammaproteobacteria bacterium]|nr:HD domain-containing protein [Gammaproteobacteria bacterium]